VAGVGSVARGARNEEVRRDAEGDDADAE